MPQLPTHARRLLRRCLPLIYGVLGASLLITCQPRVTQLERIRTEGVLRVASVYGRTTCFAGNEGLDGYECHLAQEFAKRIGLTAEITFCRSPEAALQAVLEGRADMVAAGLTAAAAKGKARFSSPIDRVGAQLVYRMGTSRPESLGDLTGNVVIANGSDYDARLAAMKGAFPQLAWTTSADDDTEDLLLKVANGSVAYTVAASSEVAIQQRYYPGLRVAFDVGAYEDVAFGFSPNQDDSLYAAAEAYLASVDSKSFSRLHDRYYGHMEEVDYFSAVTLSDHMRGRLPQYQRAFEKAAAKVNMDWRLLAAVGYQESHWNPNAVSYTGVRGLMMLTQATASRYKVANRDDAYQSIAGAAQVLADLYAQIPVEIKEPDRSWMVLAAYNQGLGHLIDARALASARGGNPTLWIDVRDAYPLLSRPRWYNKTRYGFARGLEAVDYVANVRSYYDIIAWLASGATRLPPPTLHFNNTLRTAKVAAEPKAQAQLLPATDTPASAE